MAATRRSARLLASYLLPPAHRACLPPRVHISAAWPACLAATASPPSESPTVDSRPSYSAVTPSGSSGGLRRHLAVAPSPSPATASQPRAQFASPLADLLRGAKSPAAVSSATRPIFTAPPQGLPADPPSTAAADGSDQGRPAPLAASEGSGEEEDDPILAPPADAAGAQHARAEEPDGERGKGGGGAGSGGRGAGGLPPPETVAEHGGPSGPEPTRYGDWEKGGRCIDF